VEIDLYYKLSAAANQVNKDSFNYACHTNDM